MSLPIRLVAAFAAALSLGACTVNNPPAAVATTPAPVVVQQPAPPSGTVVVQPHPY